MQTAFLCPLGIILWSLSSENMLLHLRAVVLVRDRRVTISVVSVEARSDISSQSLPMRGLAVSATEDVL